MKNKIKVRAIYVNEEGKKVKSQWFDLDDFDPVNGAGSFDWSDDSYSNFDEIDWRTELEWEYKEIRKK